MSRVMADQKQELQDLLEQNPDGVTIEDIAAELGVDLTRARRVVHDFRIDYGEDQTVNLVAEPNGANQRWLYFLRGTLDAAEPWTANRLEDMESRLKTFRAVVNSLLTATDGRTTEGKRVRILHRALTRASEDLADLAEHEEIVAKKSVRVKQSVLV